MDTPEDCPKTRAYEKECFPWRQHVEIDGVVQPYMGNHAAHSVAMKADAAIHELLAKVAFLDQELDDRMDLYAGAEAARIEAEAALEQARAEVKRLNGILNEIDAAEVDYAVSLYEEKHPAPPAEEAP